MTMQDQATVISNTTEAKRTLTISKPVQLLAAFMLGAVIMYGVGFLQTSAVHNAAHDVRHSTGFPCH